MAKTKVHPHQALINNLEFCLEELEALPEKYDIDEDEYVDAHDALDEAIDAVRQINL